MSLARAVLKVIRRISGRGLPGKCLLFALIFLTLIVLIKLLLALLTFFWPGPGSYPSSLMEDAFDNHMDQGAGGASSQWKHWRPSQAVMARVLRELNLNEDEVPRHLPLTLHSKLWLNNASLCREGGGGSGGGGGGGEGDGKGEGHGEGDRAAPVDVLFVVHTVPDHFHRRLLMRSTIAGESHFRPFKIRMVFVLGWVGNGTLQEALEMEHDVYGDMVQGHFPDTDAHLSHKGVLGLRWVWHYCPHARHVVKLDDTVFFDTYKVLLRHRIIFEGRSRTMFCHVLPKDSMRIYRQHDHPWAVEEDQFQGFTAFPYSYCSGLVVVVTPDLIPALYRAAFFTPVFWIEDVYLFGMLPAVVGGVTMVHLGHQRSFINLNTTAALSCMRLRQERCNVLATVAGTTEDWETLWTLTSSVHHDPAWSLPFLVLPSSSSSSSSSS
ncbi:acetylgalactosaminyl-O-glycosyl-glycoprotein beta-1,3-N-acetylglucosaminyltransferase-like [Babylonia areolata]|uniref:acetylgalactosaminyl-O-glycosyl-glycoprotein beta-1,3-N-acetylglucosaminyltransferase-like n=1 Tax=Babylonia areolata TaxID=304850 RepID=UPI003FD3C3E8